jgi:hypothetical protein
MRALIVVCLCFGLFVESGQASAAPTSPTIQSVGDYHHGGGCRKSSPVGQCCHMDRKAGVVHCH